MLHGVSDLDGFFEVIQSRIRGARHVEHMGHGKTTNKTLVWKQEGKNHLRDLSVYGRMILKWILNDVWRYEIDLSALG
jgi:hypothetical protein